VNHRNIVSIGPVSGRCGSTLLTHMLEKGGGNDLLTMSEPDFIFSLHLLRAKDAFKSMKHTLEDLLLAGFRVQCKSTAKQPKW